MSKKRFTNRPSQKTRSRTDADFREPPSYDEYRLNRDHYRQNLSGSSNDTMGQAETDLDDGKRFYSDVYVVGKTEKIDLSGNIGLNAKNRKQVRECEEVLKTPRLFSSKEFLEHYQKARDSLGALPVPRSSSESPTPSRSKKAKTNAGRGNASVPSEPSGKKRGAKNRNVGSEPGDRGKSVGLRVIGGRYRGTKLEYSGDHRVRPMKERVRESVFNLLGTDTQGRHVIDLFAGTGALTFEALSRGAVSATMIEIHFPTAKTAKDNIQRLTERDAAIEQKIHTLTTDVFFWGQGLEKTFDRHDGSFSSQFSYLPQTIPWLVFCSPPYDFYLERQDDLLQLIHALRKAAPADSLFVIEADDRFDFDRLQIPLLPKKRKSYPPAEIAFFKTNLPTSLDANVES